MYRTWNFKSRSFVPIVTNLYEDIGYHGGMQTVTILGNRPIGLCRFFCIHAVALLLNPARGLLRSLCASVCVSVCLSVC